jgi:hypothetical protein
LMSRTRIQSGQGTPDNVEKPHYSPLAHARPGSAFDGNAISINSPPSASLEHIPPKWKPARREDMRRNRPGATSFRPDDSVRSESAQRRRLRLRKGRRHTLTIRNFEPPCELKTSERLREQAMAQLDRATARALTEAGYMPLSEYIILFGDEPNTARVPKRGVAGRRRTRGPIKRGTPLSHLRTVRNKPRTVA